METVSSFRSKGMQAYELAQQRWYLPEEPQKHVVTGQDKIQGSSRVCLSSMNQAEFRPSTGNNSKSWAGKMAQQAGVGARRPQIELWAHMAEGESQPPRVGL